MTTLKLPHQWASVGAESSEARTHMTSAGLGTHSGLSCGRAQAIMEILMKAYCTEIPTPTHLSKLSTPGPL